MSSRRYPNTLLRDVITVEGNLYADYIYESVHLMEVRNKSSLTMINAIGRPIVHITICETGAWEAHRLYLATDEPAVATWEQLRDMLNAETGIK